MKVLLDGRMDAGEAAVWRDALAQAAPEVDWLNLTQARACADEVVAAVVANPAPGVLQDLPALRLVQSLWAGVERLLADPTLPAAVPLARMVDPAMNAAMAQTALWALLSLHRGFFDYQARQRERRWERHPQCRADEVGVLVLGYGQMGRTVAQAAAGLGYRVQAWRQHGDDGLDGAVHVAAGAEALPHLQADASIVVNLLPLTPQTRGLLDARFFAALPRGAAVVNLARGAHLVDDDLLAALGEGRLGHAVLDVFTVEPLPASHPYWSHPAVTVLPHAAAATDPRTASAVVAANLAALRHGWPLANLVSRDRGY